jgi:hypothetical protein
MAAYINSPWIPLPLIVGVLLVVILAIVGGVLLKRRAKSR